MSAKAGSVVIRVAGALLVALGVWALARSVFLEKSISADIPASLSGFAAIIAIMGGLWMSTPELLLGRRAPAFEWTAFWGGGFTMAVGTFLMAASVLDPRNEAFPGPRWIVAAAGLVFLLFGLLALRQGTGAARAGRDQLGFFLILVILSSFGAMCTWVAFGPGKREFEGGITLLFFSFSSGSGETEGRIAFGIAAVLLDVLALFFWGAVLAGLWRWMRQKRA